MANRPKFLDIGKAAFVEALIPFENEERLRRGTERHWCEYLLNRMGTALNDFVNSRLSVITFNYDRSFEHYLFITLQSRFELKPEVKLRLLRQKAIVHIYGQQGHLDYVAQSGRPYSPRVNAEIVRSQMADIRIANQLQGEEDGRRLRHICDLIHEAEVICFLGYHKQNLARLCLEGV